MSNLKFLFLFILFLATFNTKAQSSIENFKILDSIAYSEEFKTNDSIYSKILLHRFVSHEPKHRLEVCVS